VSRLVVADAGPLIALATTGHLPLLQHLFQRVLIPEAVRDELTLSSDRPGAGALSSAILQQGWLVVHKVRADASTTTALGQGESEAILLASREGALLLIDERRGRRAARAAGVPVLGTGRVLLAAKRKGLLQQVTPVLDELAAAGYRLPDASVHRLRQLAGEP